MESNDHDRLIGLATAVQDHMRALDSMALGFAHLHKANRLQIERLENRSFVMFALRKFRAFFNEPDELATSEIEAAKELFAARQRTAEALRKMEQLFNPAPASSQVDAIKRALLANVPANS